MALYEELDAMFPSHTHYYIVGLTDMNEELDKCARLSHGMVNIINYNGQMILISPNSLGSQISWLTEVIAPVVEVIEPDPVVEPDPAPTKKGK